MNERDVIRILRAGEQGNVILLFETTEEALSAANKFRKTMTKSVKDTENKLVLRTKTGFYIYFKSIQSIKGRTDGIKARVIICIPILEYISEHYGGVCTIKQFRKREVL